MDELAAGVTGYMNEEAAKECEEKPEPNTTKEETSSPRSTLTDVIEANTPRARLARSLILPKLTTQRKQLCLLAFSPFECVIRFF